VPVEGEAAVDAHVLLDGFAFCFVFRSFKSAPFSIKHFPDFDHDLNENFKQYLKEDIKQQQQYKEVAHQPIKLRGKICKHSAITERNPVEPRQLLAVQICIVHQQQNCKIINVTIKNNFHYIYRFACYITITHFFDCFFHYKSNFVTRQCQKNNCKRSKQETGFKSAGVTFTNRLFRNSLFGGLIYEAIGASFLNEHVDYT
jgi:hypothetical protein